MSVCGNKFENLEKIDFSKNTKYQKQHRKKWEMAMEEIREVMRFDVEKASG